MNVLSQIFAGVTALALFAVGMLEIFFHGDRRFHSLFLIEPDDVRAVRMWAMNVGAYNITFALGIAVGLWMVNFSDLGAGTAIVLFCCAGQVALGIWPHNDRLAGAIDPASHRSVMASTDARLRKPGFALAFLDVDEPTDT
jgi:putative membrane protein